MIYETDFKVYSSIYFGYSIRFWPWLAQQMLDRDKRRRQFSMENL